MSCGQCRFYSLLPDDEFQTSGLCRKNSPQPSTPAYGVRSVALWPLVNAERDFCGEFEAIQVGRS